MNPADDWLQFTSRLFIGTIQTQDGHPVKSEEGLI